MEPLAYLFSLEQFGIKFGLENIRAIVDGLGHPERAYRSVHIAGTNGKGSVTAMVDAGLRAAGYRVARYTSPHLVDLSERFTIGGRPVDRASMMAAIDDVRRAVETLRGSDVLEVQPTFFEVTTAVAFELFRRAGVELAVVEVGLGGRLDATNVIVPEVSAITSIAFDHQLYLGTTLREIALEKAGIVKASVPLVLGPMAAEAADAIESVAREKGAPVFHAAPPDVGRRRVALPGEHQRANAAVAMRILDVLRSRGVRVPDEAVDAALAHPSWPGRLDLRTLSDGRELLLDAAHNPAGAEALAAYLRSQGTRLPLVFAAMRDKDVAGMLRVLLPSVASATFTRATTARSTEPDHLAATARAIDPTAVIHVEPVLARALDVAWRDAPRILVAGSIFLLGDALTHLGLDAASAVNAGEPGR